MTGFWDSIGCWQTFLVALALEIAMSWNSIYQLSIMLTTLMAGFATLAHLCPY